MPSQGTYSAFTSERSTFLLTTELLTSTRPPLTTVGANLSMEGPFMAINSVGKLNTGEPTGLSESTTEQLAVPPRISGP